MGHPNALNPKTESSKWKFAVQIAENMVNNPDSFDMLEGLDGIYKFRAAYRFTKINYENCTAELDGVIVYGMRKYGDNIFFR